MDFFSVVSLLTAASGGGADIVLLLSALGGLSGVAAIISVFVTHRANTRKAATEDKSVAITELEKAVPGMGAIIQEWQTIVRHLQQELGDTKEALHDCKQELEEGRHE